MRFAMDTSGRARESLSRQVKTHQTYLSLFENTRKNSTGRSQVHLRESSAVVAITNCVRVSLGVGGSGRRPVESADPEGPACGSPEGKSESVASDSVVKDITPGCGHMGQLATRGLLVAFQK